MSEQDKMVTLSMGDWSHDGHGMSETITIKTNLSKEEIKEAYKKASDKLGFSFIDDVCEEYEDGCIPADKLDILISHGLQGFDRVGDDLDDEPVSLWTDTYANIYLFIVKLGNENFEYTILKGELNPTIDIGGYGLFRN